MTRSLDHALLAARIMRPKRSDPWPVRKLLRGSTDPAAAWAALSPKLPAALASSPTRGFQPPFVPDAGAAPSPGTNVTPTPPSVAACLAIGTDAEGMLAAEADAREVLARLSHWGVAERPNVVWTFTPTWPGAGQGGEPVLDVVNKALQRAAPPSTNTDYSMRAAFTNSVGQVQGELLHHATTPLEQKLCEPFLEAAGFASMWTRATEHELSVPSYELSPGRFVPCAGKPYAELPDPYEPLLSLILRGYALSGVTSDAILLVGTEVISQR